MAWRLTDVIDSYASGLPQLFPADVLALVLLSTDGMLKALLNNGFIVEPVTGKHFWNKIMTIYSTPNGYNL